MIQSGWQDYGRGNCEEVKIGFKTVHRRSVPITAGNGQPEEEIIKPKKPTLLPMLSSFHPHAGRNTSFFSEQRKRFF